MDSLCLIHPTAINIRYINMNSLSFERIPELESSRKRGPPSGWKANSSNLSFTQLFACSGLPRHRHVFLADSLSPEDDPCGQLQDPPLGGNLNVLVQSTELSSALPARIGTRPRQNQPCRAGERHLPDFFVSGGLPGGQAGMIESAICRCFGAF